VARVDLITTTAGVEALAARLRTAPRLALDTEFHAERRYRPRLLLLQLAADPAAQDTPADGDDAGSVHVIDPTCCELAALAPLVEEVEWVVHGGQHDVWLLAHATGLWPRRIFDTQRAAALLGLPYPARLDTLLQQRLGVDSPDSQALSNWKQRPLTDEQLRYAAADVLPLLRLADDLDAELAARGRSALARTASLDLVDEARAPVRDLDAWRRWTIAPSLAAEERAVAAALARWRDERARERDQPPHYLLGDSLMLALARTRPATREELTADRRIGSGLSKKHGDDLLAVIAAALQRPAPAAIAPEVPERLDLLRAFAHAAARQLGVAAALLLPPATLQAVAEHGPGALSGWRHDLLDAPLQALWDGSATIGLDPSTNAPRLHRDKPWPAPPDATP